METLAQLLAPTNLPSSALRIQGQDGAGYSAEAVAATRVRRPGRRVRVPLLLDSGGRGPWGRGARARLRLRPVRSRPPPPPPCAPAPAFALRSRARLRLRPACPPPPPALTCAPASGSDPASAFDSDLLMVAGVKDWGEGSGRKGREEGREDRARARMESSRCRRFPLCTGSRMKRKPPSMAVSPRYRGLGNDAELFHHGETIFISLLPISCKDSLLACVTLLNVHDTQLKPPLKLA